MKSICRFHNSQCFTGKGYWPFAQPPTWRARCCNSSDLSPGTCPARLNLPGTAVPADIASRVTKARKPPHHKTKQNKMCHKVMCTNSYLHLVATKHFLPSISLIRDPGIKTLVRSWCFPSINQN